MSAKSYSDPNGSDSLFIEEADSGIWRFQSPNNLSEEETKFLPELIALDHRSLKQLKKETPEWNEVHNLMYNAIIHFQRHNIAGSKILFSHAQELYFLHNQSNNRVDYLLGCLGGVGGL